MSAAAVTSPAPFAFHAPLSKPPVDHTDGCGEFEFRIPANAGALLTAADELFSGGKLVPLLPPPPPLPRSHPAPAPCAELHLQQQEEDEALSESEPASPRAPRCAGRRWRDLLLLVTTKKQQPKPSPGGTTTKTKTRSEPHCYSRPLLSRDSSSSSSSSTATSSSSCDDSARHRPPLRTRSAPVASLLHLMSKKPTIAAAPAAPMKYPLLTRVSSSSSSSSDSGRGSSSALPWHPRAPARPRRPAVAAESPRVSASGRVVFRGLERSSSTPAAAGAGIGIGMGARRPRPRGMERSYSTNVRVDPVINVFGFGHLFFSPASPAKEKKEREGGRRKNGPEKKLAMVLRDPHD
ncbi:pinin [Brachypodium distachyon]|uniref:Uncharacterized protein n=1 Tax=Brachypodium distachyon TaxID=15368 RepID=I1J1W6_BRADI|nr:pinin [Brachypodium distachyon]KQJ84637.1 hypothetical protein BRADI_5g21980v3 [Brachypodium distachyon]|eukprot:XP_014751086.1 pinin [Brachypodium distachyon]